MRFVSVLGVFALSIVVAMVTMIGGFFLGRQRLNHANRKISGPTVAELIRRVMHAANNGIAIVNQFGDVVVHNPAAVQLGLVHSNRIDPRATEAVQLAAYTQEPVPVDLSPQLRPGLSERTPTAILGKAHQLGDGFVVIEVSDESDAVRLEAIRRDFVANVSHELKTPVGALALLAEAVLDAAHEPQQVRRFSNKIRQEANRLGTLVTELITLSRLQGAQRLPELHNTAVDCVIAEALDRCHLAAEAAGITISVDETTGLAVLGDHSSLVTALSNLVNNAIAYSPHRKPVSISRKLSSGFIEISVTDRGIGIAPEHQKRVFERFFRVDPARSRETGGTGLGLAIVKHIAANHGGEVTVWSQVGVGSTFTLRIPAAPHISSSAVHQLTQQAEYVSS